MARLLFGLLLIMAYTSFADAGTCAGDETSPTVYNNMNCEDIINSFNEQTFCGNPDIWKEECCASWADICETFKCKSGAGQIPIDKICDKNRDCSDGSDEDYRTCYQCSNGGLVHTADVCDGQAECTDGSDEGEGTCMACGDYQLMGMYFACNGKSECPGSTDEEGCRGAADAPGDFVVELLVIVDYFSQKPYLLENNNNKQDAEKSILKDVDYFLTEINKHYANFLGSDFKIRLSKRAVILLGENEDPFLSGKLPASDEGRPRIDSDLAMSLMSEYLRDTDAYAKYQYDHAAFFTGYDMGTPSKNKWSIIGKAPNKRACDTQGSAFSVTEWTGDYQSVGVAAHEIAHNLGSDHDPETVLGYIMSPVAATTDERWWFSTLSRHNISNYMRKLNKIGNNCLLKPNSEEGYDIPNAEITEALADPNVLCARSHGPDSFYNPNPLSWTGEGNPKGDFLCNTIKCLDKSSRNKLMKGYQFGGMDAYTSDGMACGKNKVCDEGTCKASTSAVAMKANDEECLFGDVKLDGYCEDLVNNDLPGLCNNEGQKKLCCASAAVHCDKGPDYCYGDEKTLSHVTGYQESSCQEYIDEQGVPTFCFNPELFEKACCKSWATHCTDSTERSLLVRRLIDALDKELHGQHGKRLVKLESERGEKKIVPVKRVLIDDVVADTNEEKRFSVDFERHNKRILQGKRQETPTPPKLVEVDENIKQEIEPPIETYSEEKTRK